MHMSEGVRKQSLRMHGGRERWDSHGESRGMWQALLREPFASGGGCISLLFLAWRGLATGWLCMATREVGVHLLLALLSKLWRVGGSGREDGLTRFQAFCHANVDLRIIRKLARSGGARGGIPQWEVPAELCKMTLWPQES